MGDIGKPLRKIEFDPMYEPAPQEPAYEPSESPATPVPVGVPA